jgi:short-subunit dehydrogenase
VNLSGKRVLLTGATGGLGRAIARALAERDASVVLSSRKQEQLDELAGSLPGAGHRTIVSDLAQEGADLELVEAAGEIDVLVANAALPASGHLVDYSEEHVARALRVNLEAPVRMARALLEVWAERGSGHLVFLGSLSSKAATARASLYCATKFGLRGFALALREDMRGTGIGVSLVMPGFVRNAGMFADSNAKTPGLMGSATPEQVGAGVVRAIERDASQVTVAPLRARALASVAANAPEFSGRASGSTATKLADRIAEGQADKR